MRSIPTFFVLACTLGLLGCSDFPTDPATHEVSDEPTPEILAEPDLPTDSEGTVEVPTPVEPPTLDTPESMSVWGVPWFTSDLRSHWVYYWSGGAARRLTVSRISEPAEVVWRLVDVSGNGICANALVVNGSCPGGALMHGQVPRGAEATIEVDTVLSLTPHPPPLLYRLSVVLMDGREDSFEFSTYRPCAPDYPPPPNYSCN